MSQSVFPAAKVLNVGSGPVGADSRMTAYFGTKGAWDIVRADIDPGVLPDVVASVTDLGAFADGSFDAVWCSHILEHLFVHETETAAKELFRVLKPAGELYAFVPDVEAAARAVADGRLNETLYLSSAGPITPHDIFYGHGAAIAAGRVAMAHRSGFTPTKLGTLFLEAGFDPVVVHRSSDFEILAKAVKPASNDAQTPGSYFETFPS